MKPNTPKAISSLDRLSTADEIRAAVPPFSDPIEECAAEILCEIASDLGGYVRIPAVEFETSLMVDELIHGQDPYPN